MTKTNLTRIVTACIWIGLITASHAQIPDQLKKYFQPPPRPSILPPAEFEPSL